MLRSRIILLSTVLITFLACTSARIQVAADFPVPLITPLPYNVVLIIDSELSNYEHMESVEGQANWSIGLGNASNDLVTKVVGGLFNSAIIINNQDDSINLDGIDLIIYPKLNRFEFDAPIRGKDVFAESWLQFIFSAFDKDGAPLNEVVITGYGRSEIFRDREGAVNEASQGALRDAGVNIVSLLPNGLDLL